MHTPEFCGGAARFSVGILAPDKRGRKCFKPGGVTGETVTSCGTTHGDFQISLSIEFINTLAMLPCSCLHRSCSASSRPCSSRTCGHRKKAKEAALHAPPKRITIEVPGSSIRR